MIKNNITKISDFFQKSIYIAYIMDSKIYFYNKNNITKISDFFPKSQYVAYIMENKIYFYNQKINVFVFLNSKKFIVKKRIF